MPNGIVGTYTWDAASQLTGLTYMLGGTTLGNLTYAYDAAGNRTTVGGSWARTGLPQPMASASYDAANRITTWNGQTFSYDANGNVGSDGPTSYLWNARNQLSSMSGGASASFVYDGVGRRQAKTVNGTTINFLYDGVNNVQELVGGTPTANLLTGGIDENFMRADVSGSWSFLPDALGSTLALADGSGTARTQYTYEPFGATTVTGAGSNNPAQFTGRESDGTGLYYYRARYYSPATFRFTAEDPVQLGGTHLNLYVYANNVPTRFKDPSGKCPWCIVLVPAAAEALEAAAAWTAATLGGVAVGEALSDLLFPSSRKCPNTDKDKCDARYGQEGAYCSSQFWGTPLYGPCIDRAFWRWSNCRRGLPDPGPVDPRTWQ